MAAVHEYLGGSLKIWRVHGEPNVEAFENLGEGFRTIEDNVVTAFLANLQSSRFLAYIEFGTGWVRGSHYHDKRLEYFTVVRGELRAKFFVIDDPANVVSLTLTEGSMVSCAPRCVHSYMADTAAVAIEFSPHDFEAIDTTKVNVDWASSEGGQ